MYICQWSDTGPPGPLLIFSSPEHEVLMVSYCDRSMSIMGHVSFVVRHQQFPLNDYSS